MNYLLPNEARPPRRSLGVAFMVTMLASLFPAAIVVNRWIPTGEDFRAWLITVLTVMISLAVGVLGQIAFDVLRLIAAGEFRGPQGAMLIGALLLGGVIGIPFLLLPESLVDSPVLRVIGGICLLVSGLSRLASDRKGT
jgi:uncharacterized membrane protein YozB (DUF420 family)